VGKGAYGRVYKVWDKQDKRDVAIKVVEGVFNSTTDAKRTLREVAILRQVGWFGRDLPVPRLFLSRNSAGSDSAPSVRLLGRDGGAGELGDELITVPAACVVWVWGVPCGVSALGGSATTATSRGAAPRWPLHSRLAVTSRTSGSCWSWCVVGRFSRFQRPLGGADRA
jgi:hypothetical protein